MNYIQGFVTAVPASNKKACRKHAADAAALFKEFGATRMVEAWGDGVSDGRAFRSLPVTFTRCVD